MLVCSVVNNSFILNFQNTLAYSLTSSKANPQLPHSKGFDESWRRSWTSHRYLVRNFRLQTKNRSFVLSDVTKLWIIFDNCYSFLIKCSSQTLRSLPPLLDPLYIYIVTLFSARALKLSSNNPLPFPHWGRDFISGRPLKENLKRNLCNDVPLLRPTDGQPVDEREDFLWVWTSWRRCGRRSESHCERAASVTWNRHSSWKRDCNRGTDTSPRSGSSDDATFPTVVGSNVWALCAPKEKWQYFMITFKTNSGSKWSLIFVFKSSRSKKLVKINKLYLRGRPALRVVTQFFYQCKKQYWEV